MASKKKLSENVNLFENQTGSSNIFNVDLPINLEESKRLLHQIKIKEIELELENDQLKQANNELQTSLNNLFIAFQNSSIACITMLETGRIENINAAAKKLLGSTQEVYNQPNIFDFLPGTSRNIFESLLNSVKLNNTDSSAEIDLLSTTRLSIKVKTEVTYLEHNKSFNVLLIPLKNQDIEVVTKLQEPLGYVKSRERPENLIFESYNDNTPDIIIRLDTNFRIIFVNSVIEDITGISPDYFIGKKCEDLNLPKAVIFNLQNVLRKVMSTGTIQETDFEYHGEHRTMCFNLRIVAETNPHGKVNTLLGIARDVTLKKKWERALQKSEGNFKYSESIAHVGSYQHDLKTDACTWSDEFFRICGFEPQSFTPSQQKFLSIIHPDDRHVVAYAIKNAIYYKNGYKHECRIILPNGKIRYLVSTGRIITNEENEPVEIKGAIQDVTELKKIELSLKESEENYRMLFESMPVGLAISDINGKIIYGNKKSRILLGVSRTELKQGDIDVSRWKFIKKDGFPISFEDLKAYTENRSIENLEIGIIKENQKLTWLNVTAAPMQKPTEILIAIIDISEKIEREKQLQELTGKLRELNATKDKFFSIIAHDLKNPFNSILGFSDLLIKNVSKYTYDEIERFMGIIHSTSQNAYNLLENLLNWSRSQTGTIEFCPHLYEITDIILANVEFVENLALKKNISINFSPEEKFLVEIDKNMMDTVFRNLLTNAIKFSYPGGKIDIEANELKNHYEISITDYGIGIDSENLEKLFRIDNKYSSFGTSQEKGSGLGLIICKEFVERNNGKISVKSEFQKGSVFAVMLPKPGLIYNAYDAD